MAYPFIKGHIVSEQPRKGVLGAHVSTFMTVVSDLGYSPSTIQTQLTLLKGLMRWVEENHVVAFNIDESITDRFLIESGRKGARRGDHRTPYIVFLIIFGEKGQYRIRSRHSTTPHWHI